MKHLIKEGVSLAKTARIIGISRTSAYRYLKANNPKNATKVGIQRISREGDNSASGEQALSTKIDFKSYPINLILSTLLKDRTTGEEHYFCYRTV